MFLQSFPPCAFCSKFKYSLPPGRKEGRKGEKKRPHWRKMRGNEEETDIRQYERETVRRKQKFADTYFMFF